MLGSLFFPTRDEQKNKVGVIRRIPFLTHGVLNTRDGVSSSSHSKGMGRGAHGVKAITSVKNTRPLPPPLLLHLLLP